MNQLTTETPRSPAEELASRFTDREIHALADIARLRRAGLPPMLTAIAGEHGQAWDKLNKIVNGMTAQAIRNEASHANP